MKPLHRPPALKPGSRIGVFTPSWPANVIVRDKYLYGIEVLKRMGFEVVEGSLTRAETSQGYRSGTPQDRAKEFMELVTDPNVHALIATVGGSNSASLIPYLDFDKIRAHPKVICGYSDVTSLHMAILAHSGLSTFYGPAVMPSFGEWPDVLPYTKDSFVSAVQTHRSGPRKLQPPGEWSDHLRFGAGEWKTLERKMKPNNGWRALNPGEASGSLIVANLSTLLCSAGTKEFPDLDGRLLLIEQMNAPLNGDERALRQLERMGVFDAITGLIVSKPEVYDQQGAPFTFDELLLEVVGTKRKYPIITNFDCGHANPMITLAELTEVRVSAKSGYETEVEILSPMVT